VITQFRIALRLQRFEVLAAILAAGVLAASALIVRARLDAVGVPASCWDLWFQNVFDTPIPPACQDVAGQFLSINENEGGKVMASMALLPLALGVFLGVPLVAREIEGGTAPTVWTLAASRARWFAGRLVPILVVVVAIMAVLAVASDVLWSGREPWAPVPRFGDAGLHGPIVFGKGLAAFGVAVLLGALFGRVLPSVIVGALLAVLLSVGWGALYQAWFDAEAPHHRLAINDQHESQNTDGLFPGGGFTMTVVQLPDGRFVQPWEAENLAPAGTEDTYTWVFETYPAFIQGVPADQYGAWSVTETGAFSLIGIGALLLAFPVVARRRPL
jgi:hypothetical protein